MTDTAIPAEVLTAALTDGELIADLAEQAADPIHIDEQFLVVREHSGSGISRASIVDLEAEREKHREHPTAKAGVVALGDTDSFIAYVARHATAATVIYRENQLVLRAQIDDHAEGHAGWRRHTALLKLRLSDHLQPWIDRNSRALSQDDFAEHVEDHLSVIVEPDAADLLEMVQFLSGNVTTTWRSSVALKSGARELQWAESVTAQGQARDGGKRQFPGTITLSLPLFQHDVDQIELEARLRFRVRDGKLTIGYIIDGLDDHIEDRMTEVVLAVEDGLDGRQVLNLSY